MVFVLQRTGFDRFSLNISRVWDVLKTKTPKTPKTQLGVSVFKTPHVYGRITTYTNTSEKMKTDLK